MDSDTPRPESIGHLFPTVAGRLRVHLKDDGQWWTLFDPDATREEIEEVLIGLGIFLSPLRHRDFLEDNTTEKIVRRLWSGVGHCRKPVPSKIEEGFALLKEIVFGRVPTHRPLTLVLALTPLCSTSPSNLKAVLGEPADMSVMCGHDDETRMAWLWFKSLLCTLLAFFSQEVEPPSSIVRVDRDTAEVNEILRRASDSASRRKWKVVEEDGDREGDWLKASFQGRYRSNRTKCLWRQNEDDGETRETCLDEMIAARITGLCPDDGFLGLWVEGEPELVLTANELSALFISPDPWERIDRVSIPFTGATSNALETPLGFSQRALPQARVHRVTGIPFELLKGFPCIPKERQLFL